MSPFSNQGKYVREPVYTKKNYGITANKRKKKLIYTLTIKRVLLIVSILIALIIIVLLK